MKRRLGALILMMAICFSLTACGKTPASSTPTNDNNAAVSPEESSKYTVKAVGSKYAEGIYLPKLTEKQAKLTYLTNTDMEYIKHESSEESPTAIYHAMMVWKETYGVDVEIDLVDWDNFTNHLITSVTSGEGPDIVRYVVHPNWANSNLLIPLEDKMTFDESYDVEYMKTRELNGHIYAVTSKTPPMPKTYTVYNKTKFEQAGEKTPLEYYKEGKWNYTQLAKTAKNLTSAANDEYGVTGTGLFPGGVVSLKKDRSAVSLVDDDSFLKYMTSRIKLYSIGAARPLDQQGTNYRTTFPTGKDAMFLSSNALEYTWLIENAKTAGCKDEFGIAPFPVEDELGETNPRGGNYVYQSHSISAHARNQEGALEFLRLVTKIGTNIGNSMGEFGQLGNYMTDEEKEVFRNITYQDTTEFYHGGTQVGNTGISGLEVCFNRYLYPLYTSKNTKTVSQALKEMSGPLNSVVREYEISIGISQ